MRRKCLREYKCSRQSVISWIVFHFLFIVVFSVDSLECGHNCARLHFIFYLKHLFADNLRAFLAQRHSSQYSIEQKER